MYNLKLLFLGKILNYDGLYIFQLFVKVECVMKIFLCNKTNLSDFIPKYKKNDEVCKNT